MNKTDALIIGAGPTGLFTAHQLKLIGLDCEVVDNLDKIGGQCIELYPDKPIYDIPAVPECTGEELTNNLINQLKPFDIRFHLSPDTKVMKTQDNKSILIELEDEGWKFNCDNLDINIDNGLYLGVKNSYKENQNICISGMNKEENQTIKWEITKI